jgi:hypothetical protein
MKVFDHNNQELKRVNSVYILVNIDLITGMMYNFLGILDNGSYLCMSKKCMDNV